MRTAKSCEAFPANTLSTKSVSMNGFLSMQHVRTAEQQFWMKSKKKKRSLARKEHDLSLILITTCIITVNIDDDAQYTRSVHFWFYNYYKY
mmetsp:Transcript_6359/g.9401  ORF Transcript_6359/g.9401 Transcript_6359/m.9401 type:complete len:91 (-) Transcript_6359:234-506(-)